MGIVPETLECKHQRYDSDLFLDQKPHQWQYACQSRLAGDNSH
ncbi:hypothetical protein AC00_0237 [Escherichia coli 1-250-04_S3_C1]|uniref:Uncharacterized protein n=1 Tax=Escherichia coli 1-250-04_S3_C1 TaxID=1444135 RepID=A0AAN4NXA5_ECOLX|nr:hypothetical protein AC00_0237 [Escherichia coli 1-250-04_S3_C1]KEO39069.1 hypothetical protein AC28_0229 [Escherichia coli 1-250-04_S3_C2]